MWSCLPLLLAGCAFDEHRKVSSPPFIVKDDRKAAVFKSFIVIIDPSLKTDGLAKWDWDQKRCIIYLKQYPICLQHEVRHCLEGYFHDHRPNGEDCF